MAWLLRDGEVLASLEIASSRAARRRGLLGRDGIDGALLIERTRSVHTVGMRFPIDVAFCDAGLVVIRIRTLVPWRVTAPVAGARCVIEAEKGSLARWGLKAGDAVEVRS